MTSEHGPSNVDRTALAILGGVSAGRVGVACGLLAAVLYFCTSAPGVFWQDSGVHQYRIVNGILENPLGLALSHPLHYYVCRLAVAVWPGDPARAMNLVSAFAGAAGVGLLAGLLFSLTRMLTPALLGAAALTFAHTYWQMSAVTETYTISAALMILEWCVLARYARSRNANFLLLLLFINGVHVADHLLGGLTFVTYAALLIGEVTKGRTKPSYALTAGILWLVGAMPYWMLVLAHYIATRDLAGTIGSALFGGSAATRGYAAEVLNIAPSFKLIVDAVMYWGYNFPSLAIFVGIFGLRHSGGGRVPAFWRMLTAQSFIILLFVMRYPIHDQLTYYVPVCAITALWFGFGAAKLLRWAGVRDGRGWVTPALWLSAFAPVLVYALFPPLARSQGWLRSQMRDLPHRDAYDYVLKPWKGGDDSGRQFAADALRHAGPGGWFLANHAVGPMSAYAAAYYDAPTGVRVFEYREPLIVKTPASDDYIAAGSEPPLADEDVIAQLRIGGEITVAPFAELERFWSERGFLIEKPGPFWRLRLKAE